eukprot:COSAG01_NODE_2898_length_6893_cov_45.927878_1_plen_208_part_00
MRMRWTRRACLPRGGESTSVDTRDFHPPDGQGNDGLPTAHVYCSTSRRSCWLACARQGRATLADPQRCAAAQRQHTCACGHTPGLANTGRAGAYIQCIPRAYFMPCLHFARLREMPANQGGHRGGGAILVSVGRADRYQLGCQLGAGLTAHHLGRPAALHGERAAMRLTIMISLCHRGLGTPAREGGDELRHLVQTRPHAPLAVERR